MLQWKTYAFCRFSLFFILGIILNVKLGFYFLESTWFLSGFSILYLMVVFLLPKKYQLQVSSIKGAIAGVILTFLGIIHSQHFNQKNNPTNLYQYQGIISAYTGKIVSNTQIRAKTYKVELEISQVRIDSFWRNFSAKTLLYIRRDSTKTQLLNQLKYGSELLITGNPDLIQFSGNPESFDYPQYLAYQNIFHQDFIESQEFQVLSKPKGFDIFKISIQIRNYLDQELARLLSSEQSYGVASALVLGIKSHLDDEITSAYAGAGMMHILAVSGLHVGIVVLILQTFFGKIRKTKSGKIIFAIVAVLLLWAYAFLTGLSASVMRAVVMFSILEIGRATGRNTNIYNSLAISALILLLYNPFFLFGVGFQLSYVAVLGIVYLFPKIYRWWDSPPSFWNILDKAWQLVCISISAQLATFPLGLYYFHQFPNYFLLSNLLILPAIGIILGLGLATALLSQIPFLNQFLAFLLDHVLWLVNWIIQTIRDLPFAVSEGIYIHFWELLLIYACIISFLLTFEKRKFQYWAVLSFLFFVFISGRIWQNFKQQNQQKLIIFNIDKEANLNILKGKQNFFLADSTLLINPKNLNFATEAFWFKQGVNQPQILNWQVSHSEITYENRMNFGILVWQGKRFLFIRKFLKKQEWKALSQLDFDYIVFQKNAIKDLEYIPETFKISFLIIDNSNSFYIEQKLSEQAQERKILFHSVREMGAFIMEY